MKEEQSQKQIMKLYMKHGRQHVISLLNSPVFSYILSYTVVRNLCPVRIGFQKLLLVNVLMAYMASQANHPQD